MLRRLRPEPFILALTAALIVFLFTASTAPLQDLWRPLIVGVVMAAVLSVAVAAIPGRGKWPTIAFSGIWFILLGIWPLAFGVSLVAGWRLTVDALRRRQGRAPVREPADQQVCRILTSLGAAALVIALVSLAMSGAVRLPATANADPLPAASDPPSVYVVLLDGYPALGTIEDEFGYDTAPFVAGLEERGFHVADRSRSNYNRTLLTLSSMLHMEYVESVPGLSHPQDGFARQNRQLTDAINLAPVPEMFDEAGYRTVSISSSYGEATVTSVDRVIDTGAMALFEEQLLRYTAAGKWLIQTWPDLVADRHRQGVLGVLAHLRNVPAEETSPVFALAHVFSPHAPFVFNADGSPRALLDCYPQRCGMTTPELDRLDIDAETYADALVAQVTYLNGQILRTVDAIAAADPDAVIVLFSDHGVRYQEGPSAEHFRTFLATRTPGQEDLFGDDVSLVNLFPMMLNAYFGTDLAMREHRSAWASDSAPLELTELTMGDLP